MKKSGGRIEIQMALPRTTEESEFESQWDQEFPFLHVVQTGSGVHSTSYPMGGEDPFPGIKRPGREADHSPPSNADVKKIWSYTSSPPYIFMA
jgi:hypothetical protein